MPYLITQDFGKARRYSGLQEVLTVLLAVGVVAYCGMQFASRTSWVAAVWPADGVLLGLAWTARAAMRPVLLFSGFAANAGAVVLAGFPVSYYFWLPVINTLEVVLALAILDNYKQASPDLSKPSALWRFAIIAGVVAPFCAATLFVMFYPMADAAANEQRFLAVYFSHALGIITITPLVLAMRRRELTWLLNPRKLGAAFLAFGFLLTITVLICAQTRFPLLFLVAPCLVIVVVLFGLSGGALGLSAISLISLGFTVMGRGPMALIRHGTPVEIIIIEQLFVAASAVVVLFLAAILADRDRYADELEFAKREMAALATTDGLTGLANRRRLDEALDQECRRAMRNKTPLALLLLDVDHFKAYNDRYGHQAGDDCLRRIGEVVGKFSRRPGDLSARYGGEEMAVLFSPCDPAIAEAKAEVIRAAIQALELPHEGNPGCGGVVTVSIGVAGYEPKNPEADPAALIAVADAMLYAAKAAGRNRIMSKAIREAKPSAPPLSDEERRVAIVEACKDGLSPEQCCELNHVAELAASLLGVPIALVSLVGKDDQVFVGRHGFEKLGTARDVSFCQHALGGEGPLVVPNATVDPRFMNNPLVTGDPKIRFYAGAPLICTEGGEHLGTLCVIDRVARPGPLLAWQSRQLITLAALAMISLETAVEKPACKDEAA
jgi:diguanylate cyclase (GGDEF)-like protein